MKIEVVRQRRKTIMLKVVDSEHAILKVPTTLSGKKIDEFVETKRGWLEKASSKLKKDEEFSKSFDFSTYIYIFGKEYMKVQDCVIGYSELSSKAKRGTVVNYYYYQFCILEEMAKEISKKTGLAFGEIKLLDSVRIWGSFNDKKQMKLNWKLIILPKHLIYYVICHELCHSIHMNHKPMFWKDLEKICPNFKENRKELSKFGFVLKTKI